MTEISNIKDWECAIKCNFPRHFFSKEKFPNEPKKLRLDIRWLWDLYTRRVTFFVIKGLRGELKIDTLHMYYYKALHHLINELIFTNSESLTRYLESFLTCTLVLTFLGLPDPFNLHYLKFWLFLITMPVYILLLKNYFRWTYPKFISWKLKFNILYFKNNGNNFKAKLRYCWLK